MRNAIDSNINAAAEDMKIQARQREHRRKLMYQMLLKAYRRYKKRKAAPNSNSEAAKR